MSFFQTACTFCVLLSLTACGGGGGGSTIAPTETTPAATSAELAQICAPENPWVGDAAAPTKVGTLSDEKNWIKAYLNERYLWYKDIPVLDANAAKYKVTSNGVLNTFASVVNYFSDSLTRLTTASGTAVDQFSFVTTTASWKNYVESKELGYGLMVKVNNSSNPRRITVSYVYPASPAMRQGLQRGDQIISIDDIGVNDNSANGIAVLNEGLFPTKFISHRVVISRGGINYPYTLTPEELQLQHAEYKILDTPVGKLGYLLFNSHVLDAEDILVQAMTAFKQQDVHNLVVDLRYNGGGYLSIANALAASVAGSARADGKTFELVRFSDKKSKDNFAMPFSRIGLGGQTYPSVTFPKIYALVTANTCSASESFVNGLRGIDVEVELIGETTCGKPYGFYPQDNCGVTYAAMEFEGVNAKGQGGYSDGMAPQCSSTDDLTHALGDPAERMLSVAIKRMQGLTCNQATGLALGARSLAGMAMLDPSTVLRPQWQTHKILTQ